MPLRAVFMGSPPFAVPSLEALLARAQVVAVVTQPDRPKGRGRTLQPPAVKEAALRAGLAVLQPERVKGNDAFLAQLAVLAPEILVVVAYGRILPRSVLELPRLGAINVHASLLPKYRGAAPIQWAILQGETETGVTLMQMDVGMDTGPILLARRCPIAPSDTAATLSDRLARLGAELLAEGLAALEAGTVTPISQEEAHATHAPLLRKEQGRIDFAKPAAAVCNWIRGMDPWPGAFALLAEQPLRLFSAKVVSGGGPPGKVLGADRDGLLIACGEGAVAAAELQLPSRKRMSARALMAGHAIATGTVLG